jgi:nucleotide-binding universal stress UspA family protein
VQGPIVVGTDGSETGRLAIEGAATIARGSGQQVVVVFVRHVPLAGLGMIGTGGLSTGAMQGVLNADEAIIEAQSIAILEAASIPWSLEVREGEPAAELMRVASELDAETIVVAGRRHGTLGGIASASVCSHLLHRWPRSLLVIHPQPEVTGQSVESTTGPQ